MKRILKFGLLATAMVAFAFTGCKDNGDDNGGTRKQKLLLSRTEKYTENDVNHEIKYEYQYDNNKYQIGYVRTETIDGEVTNTQSETRNVKRNSQGLVEEEEQVQIQNGEVNFKTIYTYKYNEHGDCTERNTSYVYPRMTQTYQTLWDYKYDGQGNMTEMVLRSYDPEGRQQEEWKYTYDGETANVEKKGIGGWRSGVEVYTDSKHNQIKTATYEYKNSDGTTAYTTKEENTYDNKGRRTSWVSYTDGKLGSKGECTYDGDGREISYLYRNYTADGKLQYESAAEGNTSTYVYYNYSETGEVIYSNNEKTVYTDSYREDVLTYERSYANEWGSGLTKEEYKDYVVDGNTKTYTKYYSSKSTYSSGTTTETERTTYVTDVYTE